VRRAESNSGAVSFLTISIRYHGWVILLGGDARDWRTWPQRLFRVGFLLLALVVGATYTANLAAFLSNAEYEYSGPADVDEMQQYAHCILYEMWLDDYADYIDNDMTRYPEQDPSVDAATATYEVRLDWCLDRLHDESVDALLVSKASAWRAVLDDCDNLAMVPTIDMPGQALLGVFPKDADDDLVHNVTVTIRHMMQSPSYVDMRDRVFQYGKTCPAGSDLARISLGSMLSLFVVYAALGALALLFHATNNRSEFKRAVSRRMAPPDVRKDDEIYEASPVEAVVDVADADVAEEAPAAGVSGEKKPRKRKYRRRRAPPPASDEAFSSAPLSDDELAAEPRNADEDSSCACGVGY
jgi:hypothetical protein